MKISILIFMALIANSTEDGIIPFIFGGARASQGQFPHQARIQTGNGNLHCSGAIISARWILTARHCVEPMKNPSNYRIVVGSVYAGRGDFYSIVKLVAYKDWDISKDIGMIKVRGSIKFNQNVKAIQIGGGFIGGGQQVTISGWGKTEYGFTNNLMYTNLKTLSNQDCQRIASRKAFFLF